MVQASSDFLPAAASMRPAGRGTHRRSGRLTARRRRRLPGKSLWEPPRTAGVSRRNCDGTVNVTFLLSVLVDMASDAQAPGGDLAGDPDAAIRRLYSHYAKALHGYVEQFCPDRASADDIVQETFIRAWRHLPQLSADDRPVRPWLFRVARNLLIDAARAAKSRPVTVAAPPDLDLPDDGEYDHIADRQLVTDALRNLSAAHRAVLVETFY